MRVHVNGEVVGLGPGRHSVRHALAEAGVALRAGRMLAVTSGAVLDQRRPARLTVDGRPAGLATPLHHGARVRAVSGTDFVEPIVEQRIEVPPSGLPPIETTLWRVGDPGVVVRRAGQFSGEPAGEEVRAAPGLAHQERGPVVVLTFDDGPDPRFTPAILDILRDRSVAAVFCVVGVQVERFAHLVTRIHAEGHALCNHTRRHDMAMLRRGPDYLRAEIDGPTNQIGALTGAPPRFYRGPGGVLSPEVMAEAGRRGMRVLGWSVDPADYRRPGATTIQDRIVASISPGAVVLMHDGGGDRSQTVDQLPGLIDRLRAAGYAFGVP